MTDRQIVILLDALKAEAITITGAFITTPKKMVPVEKIDELIHTICEKSENSYILSNNTK